MKIVKGGKEIQMNVHLNEWALPLYIGGNGRFMKTILGYDWLMIVFLCFTLAIKIELPNIDGHWE
jgi:hypothetical protein